MNIQLRLKTESDSEFFVELFSEIKNSELHLETWPEEIKRQIIMMQYNAFEQSIAEKFPESIDYLILYQLKKAGRLQLNKNDEGIRIINISLLSAYRKRGIGSTIIEDIIKEANSKRKEVFLEVDKTNSLAMDLYNRLGFKIFREDEVKYSMKCSP